MMPDHIRRVNRVSRDSGLGVQAVMDAVHSVMDVKGMELDTACMYVDAYFSRHGRLPEGMIFGHSSALNNRERFGRFADAVESACIHSPLTEDMCFELLSAFNKKPSMDEYMYVLRTAMLMANNGYNMHDFARFISGIRRVD